LLIALLFTTFFIFRFTHHHSVFKDLLAHRSWRAFTFYHYIIMLSTVFRIIAYFNL
jgi:hypothetical protein